MNGTIYIEPAGKKIYKALLTQSTQDRIISGELTVGLDYLIISNTTGDFTNVGAADNKANTHFKATGTTPTSWGDAEIAQNILPIATVLENTLGEVPMFRYYGIGRYRLTVNAELFVINKTVVILGSNASKHNFNVTYRANTKEIFITTPDATDVNYDEVLNETLILIEIYP